MIAALAIGGCLREAFAYGHSNPDATELSLAQLVENRQQYDGKTVRVRGRLHLEFEGNSLSDGRVSVWPATPALSRQEVEIVNDRRVWIEGRYNAKFRGHMGIGSQGSIDVIFISTK